MLLNLLFPDFIESIRYGVLAIVILVIGMPHGALDHIITYQSFPNQSKRTKRLGFYGYYFLMMTAYGLLWLWFPLGGFLLFLLITIYHFGRADAERFDFDESSKLLLTFTRGITIVGLIVYGSEPAYISRIVEVLTGYNSMALVAYIKPYFWIPLILAAVYPLAYAAVLLFTPNKTPSTLYHIDAIIVPVLFALGDPIFAFSIYFGVWHSYNHAQTMLRYLQKKQHEVSMKWFYQKTMLLSLISYAGLAVLYVITEAFGDMYLLLALLFVLISVLTLPHIFVVEMMYRKFGS
ncbi:beta-carotene 15,15'-monooxygenase, Brp/Blh family [Gracilimonas mengyeensis]|uniref:Probable beta-carotene 15,15'-dioxygenase n=1 Tax=Gracilimonas mengyeensis TaxID=1302730 RepID=A0A521ER10_9BACT|nr:beta-carotene 15,15'-monooxygenase, Brp/Blh family [Gracilimonas mengyeensis]